MLRFVPIMLAVVLPVGARALRAQAEPTMPAPYTAAQADRGEAVFRRICAQCHVASQFTGAPFKGSWGGRPVYDLYELIRTTMPQDNPGRLRRQEYVDVITYFLRMNHTAPGDQELVAEPDSLRRVVVPATPNSRN